MKYIRDLPRTGLSVLLLLSLNSLLWGQAEEKPVLLVVHVAPDALLEIQGYKTQQTGALRRFQSPPIAVDQDYSFTLRAAWKQSGKVFETERKVAVRAGQTVEVDLRPREQLDRLPTGSFTLLEPEPVALEQGETKKIMVRIRRQDFNEPVKVTYSQVPPAVKFTETTIPADQDSAEVKVTAEKGASPRDWYLWVWATAGDLREFRPIKVTVRRPPSLRLQLPATLKLKPGAKERFSVRIQREGFEGPVAVEFQSLPSDVQIPALTIPADKNEAEFEATVVANREGPAKEAQVLGSAGRVKDESRLRITIEHKPPLVEAYLVKGQFAEGETALRERLKGFPKDDQARFGLGALQFIQAVEHLGRSFYRYGLRSDRGQLMNIPFLRLPVPINPTPEVLTYPATRKILQDLIADLQKAETTLAAVQDEQVKLPLHLGPIRLDFAGGGKADSRFITLLNQYLGGVRSLPNDEEFLVVFDRGDVAWLRGYSHLLMALSEMVLAYEGQELFDCASHLFFARVQTPHQFLTETRGTPRFFDLGDGVDIVDVIAFFHLVRMPVREPARLKAALAHLEQMLALSKESWNFILAETDDDHEWIPNPRQRGVLRIAVRPEMVKSWLEFVEEAEALLAGKRLVPFWRGGEGRGVNLRRVFTEPRPFDLVLWVQGAAATPYLDNGRLTKPAVWEQLRRVFGGELFGFALWFN